MSKQTKEAPWTRYGITQAEWNSLTPEGRRKKRYDRWYKRNRDKRNRARRKRYKEDEEHRARLLQERKERRPAVRAEKAEDKFQARLDAIQRALLEQSDDESEETSGGGRKGLPRFVGVAGQELWVHTSRRLAEECGRGQSTIRAWLAQDVLPGCTIVIKERYYFSDAFIAAIREACRLVYYENGNGSREVLARLIREQLREAGCSYVPPGGNEKNRVYP